MVRNYIKETATEYRYWSFKVVQHGAAGYVHIVKVVGFTVWWRL